MGKKTQASLYVIIGLIILTVISILYFTVRETTTEEFKTNTEATLSFAETKTLITTYVTSCAENVVKELIEETGIREETLPEYESLIATNLKQCVSSLFSRLREQGYTVSEDNVIADAEINDETIVVNIDYPIVIERGDNKIDLKTFFITFDRAVNQHIDNGLTDDEVVFTSTDGRATITIPRGVEITDSNGNPVEDIGLKVDDLHFDGLGNGIVIGNLVFEAYPDGIQFSQPIELMIEFRQSDLPEGVDPAQLSIAWWDESMQLWRALPTVIMHNVAITETTHFSIYSVGVCAMEGGESKVYSPDSLGYQREFNQRYSVCNGRPASECGCEQEIAKWDNQGDLQTPVALYAEDTKHSYFDYYDADLGHNFGYYYGTSFMDCMEKSEWLDPAKDFIIKAKEWEEKECDYSGSEPPTTEEECIKKACDNSKPGQFCNYDCYAGDGSLIASRDDGQCHDDCLCGPIIEEIDDDFGYPDARCAGGYVDAGDLGAVSKLILRGGGFACAHFEPTLDEGISVSLDCSDNVFSDIAPSELIGLKKEGLTKEDIESLAVPISTCNFIKYSGTNDDYMILSEENTKTVLGVRGVKVTNENNDACAYAGVIWTVKAMGVESAGAYKEAIPEWFLAKGLTSPS